MSEGFTDQLMDEARAEATNLNLVEGLASYPIPLWKPKADRIVSQTLKAITGIDPYVQCIPLSLGR